MPRIIVQSDAPDRHVTHQERVCSGELESEFFSRQLIERVSWAVSDAEDAERVRGRQHERHGARTRRPRGDADPR